jgi:hypothetical protein
MARYLIGLRPVLTDACATRNEWVRRLGLLIQETRSGDIARVARGAGALGREFGDLFRNARSRINLLTPPPECDLCHVSVRAWTEALLGSCEALAQVGRTSQLHGLRIAQEHLADARTQAHRFNDEYARLSQELRRRVQTARRRGDRLPTRRQASPS